MKKVQSLKKSFFTEADICSLAVCDESNNQIAKLVPIGDWALSDEELLNSFAKWRDKFMRYFLTIFNTSADSTKQYLKNFSIREVDRIFFAIYEDNLLVGHIGLSNLNNKAELDNIIRGERCRHRRLMYFVQKTLLNWAFITFNPQVICAQVLSFNFRAISLHKRFGLKLKEQFFLRKKIMKSFINYEKCEKKYATEKFYLNILEVSRADFEKID